MDDPIDLSDRQRAILGSVLGRFADRIDRVAVFGSRALARARPSSDIDLALCGGLDDAAIARIRTLFDDSSLAVTVDVVRYDALEDGSLKRHIDRYGQTLFVQRDLAAIAASNSDERADQRVSPPPALG